MDSTSAQRGSASYSRKSITSGRRYLSRVPRTAFPDGACHAPGSRCSWRARIRQQPSRASGPRPFAEVGNPSRGPGTGHPGVPPEPATRDSPVNLTGAVESAQVFGHHPFGAEAGNEPLHGHLDAGDPTSWQPVGVARVEERDDLVLEQVVQRQRVMVVLHRGIPLRTADRPSALAVVALDPPAVEDAQIETAVDGHLHAARPARFERWTRKVSPTDRPRRRDMAPCADRNPPERPPGCRPGGHGAAPGRPGAPAWLPRPGGGPCRQPRPGWAGRRSPAAA